MSKITDVITIPDDKVAADGDGSEDIFEDLQDEVDVEIEQEREAEAKEAGQGGDVEPERPEPSARKRKRRSGGEKLSGTICRLTNSAAASVGVDPVDPEIEQDIADAWEDVGEFMDYRPTNIWAAGAIAMVTTLIGIAPTLLAIRVRAQEIQMIQAMQAAQEREEKARNVTPGGENTDAGAGETSYPLDG